MSTIFCKECGRPKSIDKNQAVCFFCHPELLQPDIRKEEEESTRFAREAEEEAIEDNHYRHREEEDPGE